MKKPRPRWSLLFALLLGAGAWWGIGWWMIPRPYWEGRYHIEQFAPPVPQTPPIAPSSEPQIEEIGKRIPKQLNASVLDRLGRYLLIEQNYGPACYEVIDLFAGRSVAKHLAHEPWGVRSNVSRYDLVNSPVGNMLLLVNLNTEYDKLFHRSESHLFNLWQWNVLSNDLTLLKQYPRGTTAEVSRDGSTLLEIERRTAMLPSLLLLGNVPNLLAGMVEAKLRLTDLAVMRVWSLPAMTLRSSMTLPWIYRQDTARLSADGAYLVMADAALPEGMTSPHLMHKARHSFSRGRVTEAFEPYCATSPKGCRVYESETMKLKSEHEGYDGAYQGVLATHPDFFAISQGDEKPKNQKPGLNLHLPSMTWKEGDLREMVPLHGRTVQTSTYLEDEARIEIAHVAPDGTSTIVSHSASGTLHTLLPHGTQYLIENYSSRADSLPAWLFNWLLSKDILTNWLNQLWETLEVKDYTTNRTLLSRRSSKRFEYSVSDHWLIIAEDDREHFHIAVYALPLPSWSPWWARGAGMVILLFNWLAFTRGRGHAVRSVPPAS